LRARSSGRTCGSRAASWVSDRLAQRLEQLHGRLVLCSPQPVGLTPGRTYRDQSVLLARGDTLFADSDGISEGQYAAGTPPSDDITAIAIRRL
jgi:hypothetical protein